ncbi:PREDICTED: LOW QUALITY PROTEIN: RING finger protein 10 [Ceratosolen solmsi marchali]|uniref:E3 ubiquitin-protein ligase RNF10 n=1 Tax=Ceratosolen solmsi marchali TaxID=326594 RepID=A0AAJ6YX40_9HYME|nr:PREDICTED: LOW QUALITY PROTEIN: RING finger protein 10 [Ceratosolen solmsi marchali]
MDKKAKYQQPNAKGTVVDTKKNQDVVSSKLCPKSSRRRESPGANSFPKNDQPRKSNAQKAKNFDKRPKLKGHYHGGSKEDSKVAENESAELGSVMAQGSKKQNLNHLLNFSYTPRYMQSEWNHGRISSYNNYNYNRWLPAVQRHKYNKEQFLQANCQFVVTAKGDYSLYLNDPDILIDWKLIEQIRVHNSENLLCPICLDFPLAGKMTRCGHVYCWPCILHYLALSNNSGRKCPICYEFVNKSDLKSVVEITKNVLNIGDQISLRLMRREKGTLLAVPVDNSERSPTTFLSVSENINQHVYSKLLLAEDADIMDIIESERSQLNIQLLEDSYSLENCFIEQACNELSIREQLLLQNISPIDSKTNNEPTSANENIKCREKKTFDSIKIPNNYTEGARILQLMDNLNCDNDESKRKSQKFYFFYRLREIYLKFAKCQINTSELEIYVSLAAVGGQNVYLHAMNIKMLEMQYGSLEKSPQVISGTIIEKEVGSLTHDLRKRMRYLCHLPVTSQFEMVEIDLQPPIISKEVLTYFEGQISSRQHERKRREREEQKREKKITEEENKRMGKYPKPKVHIESHKHFPQFQPETDAINIPSSLESVAASSAASSPSTCSIDDVLTKLGDEANNSSTMADQGPSFAQMLRTNGSKKAAAWSTLHSSKKESYETSVTPTDSSFAADLELDEYVPPAYNRNLGDALAQALEKSDLLSHGDRPTDNVNNGKKKKKKGKTTVLFATNMARTS